MVMPKVPGLFNLQLISRSHGGDPWVSICVMLELFGCALCCLLCMDKQEGPVRAQSRLLQLRQPLVKATEYTEVFTVSPADCVTYNAHA